MHMKGCMHGLAVLYLMMSLYNISHSVIYHASLQMHGEDSTSYARNSALLRVQYMKKDPAQNVIKSLMELTVWKRREEIEGTPEDVLATLDKYPYLGDKEFVSL